MNFTETYNIERSAMKIMIISNEKTIRFPRTELIVNRLGEESDEMLEIRSQQRFQGFVEGWNIAMCEIEKKFGESKNLKLTK